MVALDPFPASVVVMTTTPTDRLLTASLVVAPLIYPAADSTYAARGWDDATAGVMHVLGAIGYGLVVLRIATRLPRESRLKAALVLVGLIGMAGNVAYGFDTIHMSLGDTQLVDQPGAANLIKPIGLFFPLSLALVAAAAQAGAANAGRQVSCWRPSSCGRSRTSATSPSPRSRPTSPSSWPSAASRGSTSPASRWRMSKHGEIDRHSLVDARRSGSG
ncbi:hypothetical protein [Nocardioides sp. B-3]|uniref:hypothetical protein n=1 Tax=Nocardioides sp. B-3 TaxID=2895565 RepID=UPI002152A4EA|nr:hypothetical protein [Nocardioides sp. B-3]UUZ58247.1 hypothetical protein LP418_18615 [Nocardioides sp. B-3]